jgi:predicted RecB family nuclease
MEKDHSLDQSLNIGSEIRLFDGCVKQIKIGSIKLIREIRQKMKDLSYKFSYSIGRDKWISEDGSKEVDWPAVEEAYTECFNLVLVGGLSDDEYDNVDEAGIKELDDLLDRFL